MTKEKFYEVFGSIDEDFVQEAYMSVEIADYHQDEPPIEVGAASASKINTKKHILYQFADMKTNGLKRGVLVACLCLLVLGLGVGIPQYIKSMSSGGGFFGNRNDTILAAHRNEITPEIENSILEQLQNYTEVKKTYVLLFNTWFLSDELTDFSQVVTNEVFYVVPGNEENPSDALSYTIYTINEAGKAEWNMSAYTEEEDTQPSEFFGLTYKVIEDALSGITYEDYIITYSHSIRTVIIWVRSETEDVFLTYPSRSDFVGLEVGGMYTLEEMQGILTEAYKNN